MSARGDIIRTAAHRVRQQGYESGGDLRAGCYAAADVLDGLAEVTEAIEEPRTARSGPKDMLQLVSVPPEAQPDATSEPVLVDPNYVASAKPSSVGTRLTMLNGERIYVINRTGEVCAIWSAMRS